jgi:outer membrane lipase/esterase
MTRSFDLYGVSTTAPGAPKGHLAAFGADAGYRFERQTGGGPLRWGPVSRLRFNNTAIGDYSESGFGSLSSHIRGRDAMSLQTGLGVEASFEVPIATGSLVPYLRATWQHEFAETAETAVANFLIAPEMPFALRSGPLGRDFVAIAAGVSGRLSGSLALSAAYVGNVGRRGENVHQLSLSVRVAF